MGTGSGGSRVKLALAAILALGLLACQPAPRAASPAAPAAARSPTPPSAARPGAPLPTAGAALSSSEVITATVGPSRLLAPDFIGLDGDLLSANVRPDNPWDEPKLVEAFKKLNAGHLRYPGGTLGNYWNAQSGRVESGLDEAQLRPWVRELSRSKNHYPLENLKKIQAASGVNLLWVLNMVTEDLDSQLAMLKRAAALGLPVKRLELGNEFYLGNNVEPLVQARFPTAQVYAREVNRWTAALRRAFPDAQVAAIGAPTDPTAGLRQQSWNDEVAPALSEVRALTLHLYPNSGLESAQITGPWGSSDQQREQYRQLADRRGPAQVLAQPFQAWRLVEAYGRLPAGEIWITEFNLDDRVGAVRGTWAHGLAVAGFLHVFLSDPRVTLVSFHNVAGDSLAGAIFTTENAFSGLAVQPVRSTLYELSAAGQVLALFGEASTGMDRAAPLLLNLQPYLQAAGAAPYPAVWGWQFSRAAERRLILANLSSDPRTVNLSPLQTKGMLFRQLSGAPTAYLSRSGSLTEQTGAAADLLLLPPYSLSLLTR